jgi:hypothetical protein
MTLRGGEKMKTKYKYVRFEHDTGKGSIRDLWWCRDSETSQVLGAIEFSDLHKQFVFIMANEIIFTADCLRDIADFMEQVAKA